MINNVKATIEITSPKLITEAYSLHYKVHNGFFTRNKSFVLGLIFLSVGVIFIFNLDLNKNLNLFLILISFFLGGINIISTFYMKSKIGNKILKKFPELKVPVVHEFSEKNIIIDFKNDPSVIEWGCLVQSIVSENYIMIYDETGSFKVLPKVCFNNNDFELLVELLKNKIENTIVV